MMSRPSLPSVTSWLGVSFSPNSINIWPAFTQPESGSPLPYHLEKLVRIRGRVCCCESRRRRL
jgi:hypothetical protein